MKQGYLLSAVVGILWSLTIIVCLTIVMAFSTGLPVRPIWLVSLVQGAAIGLVALFVPSRVLGIVISFVIVLGVSLLEPFGISLAQKSVAQGIGVLVLGLGLYIPLRAMTTGMPTGVLTRHQFEEVIVRFLTGFGYVFFTAIVVVPFYVMLMTSIKGQQALLLNPLDFSIEWEKGWGLLRSYKELFLEHNFGRYMATSFFVSVATVLVTLLFSVPGPMLSRACVSRDRRSCLARSC